MDVEPGRESSCTMVAMKTFEPRRDSDERQNIQAHGLRGVWRIGRRQAEHLGDLHQSSRIYSFLAYAVQRGASCDSCAQALWQSEGRLCIRGWTDGVRIV